MLIALLSLFVLAACKKKTETRAEPRAAHAYAPPPIRGAVTDTAGRLSAADDAALEARITQYRTRTGNEIAVFIVGSLAGAPIEDVAYGAFNTWGIGKKGADNGVLLVIAPNERRTRIETGKGIGDKLTDLESSRILRERTGPLLKQERFRDAVDATLEAIEAALDGRAPPPLRAGAPSPLVAAGADAGAPAGLYVLDYTGALDETTRGGLEREALARIPEWRRFAIVLVATTAAIDASVSQKLAQRRQAGVIAPSNDFLVAKRDGFIVYIDVSNRGVVLATTSIAPPLDPDFHGRLSEAARAAPTLAEAVRAVAAGAASEARRLDDLWRANDAAEAARKEKEEGNAVIGVLATTFGILALFGGIVFLLVRRAGRGGGGGSSYSSGDSSYGSSYDSSSSYDASSSYDSSSSTSSSDTSYEGGGGSSGGGGASDSY